MAKRKITNNPVQGLFNKAPEWELAPAPEVKNIARPDFEASKSIDNTNLELDSNRTIAKVPLVVSPQQQEARSQRKQILLQPSVHDRAEEKCKQMGISMNEAINQLLINWIDLD